MSVVARSLLGFAFATGDLLIETDAGRTITLAIGATQVMVGVGEEALKGRSIDSLATAADQSLVAALLDELADGERRGPVVVRLAGQGAVSLVARRVPENGGKISCVLSQARTQKAGSGPDGLHDRAGFEQATRNLTEVARATGVQLELAMVEMTGLAQVKSGLPKKAAQALDSRVAGALRVGVGAEGAAARLEGDRFALLREKDDSSEVMVRRLARLLTTACAEMPIRANAQSFPVDQASPARMARAMRYALDDFVRGGLSDAPPASLSQAMNQSVKRILSRAGELGMVVSERRFDLAFQPVVSLDTGEAHHHEVLVRFEEGVSPFPMVRMAEEFDLIEDLDHAIIEQTLQRLRADRSGKLSLAVNVSGRSISSEPFVEQTVKRLKADPRLKGRLIFEITESAAIDDLPRANRHIQAFRELGSLVCLDDFGSGAASLAYLQELSVDIVKIDGRYVRDLTGGGRDAAMVRHLVGMCRELKLRTVAEMVETVTVEQVIRDAGVDFAQGWLYGRPADTPQWPKARAVAPTLATTAPRRRGSGSEEWR